MEPIDVDTFETLVADALATIPDELRVEMDNVAIIIDDESPPGPLTTASSFRHSGCVPARQHESNSGRPKTHKRGRASSSSTERERMLTQLQRV
jgi:hypothetical protein